ncbi:hypothetical protein PSACC_02546 [Paramicrosporidium saccamoebae]|uniref:Uncharacterized protein n=1 Tax=Paramicrosporidium saccamoebae TaxID=1246581 RepID=A0A2H9TIR8_9FUNG|nr:hypothetical protein PSACC_02546 [Paramicrosporidium saccamoebae]
MEIGNVYTDPEMSGHKGYVLLSLPNVSFIIIQRELEPPPLDPASLAAKKRAEAVRISLLVKGRAPKKTVNEIVAPATARLVPQLAGPDMSFVYTYYEPALGYAEDYTQRITRLWLRSWHIYGYKPRILILKDMEKHANFTRLTEIFSSYPTFNDPYYELICYRRWMAFEMIGGGTFMDYDILALGEVHFPQVGYDEAYSYPFNLWPMLAHAGPPAIARHLALMANYTDSHESHISDMIILRNHPEKWDALNEVVPCNREDFAETIALLARLSVRRVVLVMPPTVQMKGSKSEYGLQFADLEVAYNMQDWVNSDENSRHLIPRRLSDDEMQVPVITQWPVDYEEGRSLVLLVYSLGRKNTAFTAPETTASNDELFLALAIKTEKLMAQIMPLETQLSFLGL